MSMKNIVLIIGVTGQDESYLIEFLLKRSGHLYHALFVNK